MGGLGQWWRVETYHVGAEAPILLLLLPLFSCWFFPQSFCSFSLYLSLDPYSMRLSALAFPIILKTCLCQGLPLVHVKYESSSYVVCLSNCSCKSLLKLWAWWNTKPWEIQTRPTLPETPALGYLGTKEKRVGGRLNLHFLPLPLPCNYFAWTLRNFLIHQ